MKRRCSIDDTDTTDAELIEAERRQLLGERRARSMPRHPSNEYPSNNG